MPESFGARLRQRREERQVDLTAIAAQTKIKVSLLDALERDDVSHWPSGIFRRAYIRAYAQAIGLDPDVVLREFLELHPDPADLFASLAAGQEGSDNAAKMAAAPPTRLRTIVGSAIGSLTKLRRTLDTPRVALGTAAPASAVTYAAGEQRIDDDEQIHDQQIQTEPDVGLEPEIHLRPPAREPDAADVDEDAHTRLPQSSPLHDVAEPMLDLEPPAEHGPVAGGIPAAERGSGADGIPPAPARDVDVPSETPAPDPTPEVRATSQTDVGPRLETLADVCTELGRVVDQDDLQSLLRTAARVLDASGLILWLTDETGTELEPVLVHGYPESVVAHLPAVRRDANNPTAAAFRTERACDVSPTPDTSGALVVPLLAPEGCAGVLAIELLQGIQPARSRRALARLLSAALAQLVHRSRAADAQETREVAVSERYG